MDAIDPSDAVIKARIEKENEFVRLQQQVEELQGLIDRQADTIHTLKHDRKCVLEGIRARCENLKLRAQDQSIRLNELIAAIDKELLGG